MSSNSRKMRTICGAVLLIAAAVSGYNLYLMYSITDEEAKSIGKIVFDAYNRIKSPNEPEIPEGAEKTPRGITLVKETVQSKPLLRLAGLLILIWGGWNLLGHTGKKAAVVLSFLIMLVSVVLLFMADETYTAIMNSPALSRLAFGDTLWSITVFPGLLASLYGWYLSLDRNF